MKKLICRFMSGDNENSCMPFRVPFNLRDNKAFRRNSLLFTFFQDICSNVIFPELKGKLGDFFYLFKVFIGPKLRHVSTGNFHRKAPKLVKNQAKGSEIHQIRTKWLPTYCGNPSILASDLLWESTNSGFRATVGIHSSI